MEREEKEVVEEEVVVVEEEVVVVDKEEVVVVDKEGGGEVWKICASNIKMKSE